MSIFIVKYNKKPAKSERYNLSFLKLMSSWKKHKWKEQNKENKKRKKES